MLLLRSATPASSTLTLFCKSSPKILILWQICRFSNRCVAPFSTFFLSATAKGGSTKNSGNEGKMSFLNNQEQQQNGAQQQIQFHQRRQMSSTSSNQQEASYQMANPEKLTTSERGKRFAAYECAQAEIRDGLNLGIGSGSTVKYLVDWMHEKNATGGLQHIRCVPTSFQTEKWLRQAKLPVSSLDDLNELDLAIDGADEVDAQLTCIKGGGGCLLREKVVQSCAKRFILIGNLEKYSEVLGTAYKSCAIEVVPFACAPVIRWITEKAGGECVLRMDQRNCFPSITENSNYILDWHFPQPVLPGTDWPQINQLLLNIAGVVETGFFIGVAEAGYFGTSDGKVKKLTPKTLLRLPYTEEGVEDLLATT